MNASEEKLAAVVGSAEQLFSEAEVHLAARDLAETIARSTQGQELLVLCVMNGGLVATGLLLPHLPNLLRLDYIHATRYRDQTHGDTLRWLAEPRTDLAGQQVLVVDDIFDEGVTLNAICEYCKVRKAHKVLSAVLVNKQHSRKPGGFVPDFIGLQVPDRYVFGCGMDYGGYWRNLPGIYALAE